MELSPYNTLVTVMQYDSLPPDNYLLIAKGDVYNVSGVDSYAQCVFSLGSFVFNSALVAIPADPNGVNNQVITLVAVLPAARFGVYGTTLTVRCEGSTGTHVEQFVLTATRVDASE